MTGNKRKNQEREGNNERNHKMKQEKKTNSRYKNGEEKTK